MRKSRSTTSQTPLASNEAVASLDRTEATQPIATFPDRKAELSSVQNGSGPQLLHRSASSGTHAANSNNSKQQSVALVDTDASGQIGKKGEHDKKEALQQSVTAAAGIYRRLGAVDRH
jgi:hypothetical protein